MSQSRERAIPALVAIAILLAGGLSLLLLDNAADSGVRALEKSLQGEVSAVARSQDQRVSSTLNGAAGLAQQAWELTPESSVDDELLNDLLQFIPDLRTGFYVTDADLEITQGVNLSDRQVIGTTYDREGIDSLVASATFRAGLGGYLPVGDGLTTELPTTAAVFPILDPTTGGLRGTFVFESEIVADSSFNSEISQLSRGETGQYLFYDTNGTIIAANDPSLLATTVPDTFVAAEPGLRRQDGDVIVIENVPAAGWRVAFRQDAGEFTTGLSGPIQTVGRIVVVASVFLGGLLFVLLARRLRAAREEQERLRRLSESQDEFISIVSHELRTPVAGVLGFLQTSLDHWDTLSDDARRAAVTRSASNARRLQSLTRDVLDSQAAESGRMAFSMDRADLAEEVGVAVEAAQSLYPDHRIVLETDLDTAPVTADVDRIQQVLTNLLDNAARISPPSEPVEVALARSGDEWVVTVSDHGPGLAADGAEKVFEKFVRGHVGSVSGTGLGLYISRQIVEAHGGEISVDSAIGRGAVFTVRLPATKVPEAAATD